MNTVDIHAIVKRFFKVRAGCWLGTLMLFGVSKQRLPKVMISSDVARWDLVEHEQVWVAATTGNPHKKKEAGYLYPTSNYNQTPKLY
jgi:hypothetical protein